MTSRRAHDARLSELTPLVPEPSRAEAVRLRCRAKLARRARTAPHAGAPFARVFVPVLLGAFAAFYAAALLGATLRIVTASAP